jgi:CubicO group peptidase (beta-lactamase class C family)
MPKFIDTLQQRLDDCVRDRDIPGVSIAVLHEGEVHTAASGLANRETGVEVTPDTVFMIGSTTKVLTATLLMQLVDEGRVDLDVPANRYLPEVNIGRNPLPDSVTVRMLLNHTSGIDGDFFIDTGWNDDAVEKYCARLNEVDFLHPPGRMRSYCNAAYSLTGRIIEKQRETDFCSVMRKCLFTPAGIRDAVLLPAEFLRYRAVIGYDPDRETGGWKQTAELIGPRGTHPAGTAVSMSAASLLELGRIHMRGGLAADGTRILSEAGVAELQLPLTGVVPALPDCQGWALYKGSGTSLYNHYGGTAGQNAWFGIIPDRGFAMAVLSNSQTGAFEVNLNLTPDLLRELANFEMEHPEPPAQSEALELESYVGRFERHAMNIEVFRSEEGLRIRVDDHFDGELNPGPDDSYALVPAGVNRFVVEGQILIPAELAIEYFFEKHGRPQTLIYFGRAHRRTD